MPAAASGSITFPHKACATSGRAPDNAIVIDDPCASRYHAHIKSEDGQFTIVDGAVINGQLRRSANKVFINGEPKPEWDLKNGDRITIGASTLRFDGHSRNAPAKYVTTTSRSATRNC